MFDNATLDGPGSTARGYTFAVSLTAQVALLGTVLLIPLLFIQAPEVYKLSLRILPPPSPRPHVQLVEVPRETIQRFLRQGKLFAPTSIPKHIARIVESQALPEGAPEIGVIGGDPAGARDGVPNSILTAMPKLAPPPPKPQPKPAEAPKQAAEPTRVGGDVQSAKLLHRVMPVYPPLARQARVSGTVKLIGIINREGRIVSLQLVSGHPLLAQAALEAVRQWVYKPTLLNNEPVEVIAPIDVNFVLNP